MDRERSGRKTTFRKWRTCVRNDRASTLVSALIFLSLCSLAFLAYVQNYQSKSVQYIQLREAYLSKAMMETAQEKLEESIKLSNEAPTQARFDFNHGHVLVNSDGQAFHFTQVSNGGYSYQETIPIRLNQNTSPEIDGEEE